MTLYFEQLIKEAFRYDAFEIHFAINEIPVFANVPAAWQADTVPVWSREHSKHLIASLDEAEQRELDQGRLRIIHPFEEHSAAISLICPDGIRAGVFAGEIFLGKTPTLFDWRVAMKTSTEQGVSEMDIVFDQIKNQALAKRI